MRSIPNNLPERFPWHEKKAKRIVAILYAVGIIGTIIPFTREIFIFLTPVILVISFFILIYFHTPGFEGRTILIFFLIGLISFLVEVAGVKTGVIFGGYNYGNGLGLKFFDTPLLIGLNWVLLIYCTAVISDKFPGGFVIKAAGASLLMVIYDLIMEQVAPKMDMWTFEAGIVPFRNYLSWFLLAFIFHSAVRLSGVRPENRIAPFLFYCQASFFLILFIFYKLSG